MNEIKDLNFEESEEFIMMEKVRKDISCYKDLPLIYKNNIKIAKEYINKSKYNFSFDFGLYAVLQNGVSLEYVPKKLKSIDLILDAININIYSVFYINKKLLKDCDFLCKLYFKVGEEKFNKIINLMSKIKV